MAKFVRQSKTYKCFRTDFRTDRFFGWFSSQLIVFIGGTAGTRTQDQSLKRALLYQLSYRPNQARMIAEVRNQITGNARRRFQVGAGNSCNKSCPRVFSLE